MGLFRKSRPPLDSGAAPAASPAPNTIVLQPLPAHSGGASASVVRFDGDKESATPAGTRSSTDHHPSGGGGPSAKDDGGAETTKTTTTTTTTTAGAGADEAAGEEFSSKEEYGTKPNYAAVKVGIQLEGRRCTDILFLILFLCVLGGMVVAAAFGLHKGQPDRLIFPTDYMGNICGRDNTDSAVAEAGDIFDPTSTICGALDGSDDDEAAGTGRFSAACLQHSARDMRTREYLAFFSSWDKDDLFDFGGICVEYCPGDGVRASGDSLATFCPSSVTSPGIATLTSTSCTVSRYADVGATNGNAAGQRQAFLNAMDTTIKASNSMGILTNSTPLFYRCKPVCGSACSVDSGAGSPAAAISAVGHLLDDSNGAWRRTVGAIGRCWKIIIICAAIAFVAAVAWIAFMRVLAGLFVWVTVLGLAALLFGLSYFCESRSSEMKEFETLYGSTNNEYKYYKAGTWFFGIIGVIYLLIVVAMRQRIRIAVGILNEASSAIGHFPWIALFPIWSQLFTVVTVGLAAYVFIYLYSSGKTVRAALPPTYVIDHKLENQYQYAFIYFLFGFLWLIGFYSSVVYMTLAGAFATWYWTKPPKTHKTVPASPIWRSFVRTLRYHLGTIAFGTLIVAIIEMIRFALAYIEKQVRASTGDTSPWLKWFFCLLQCCVACFERFIRFLNKLAYIHTAVFGTNFCTSAKNAFFLLLRNVARISIVTWLSDFLLFLGKACVTVGVILIGWKMIEDGRLVLDSSGTVGPDGADSTQFDFQIGPLIVIGFIGWYVSHLLLAVYEVGVDTILVSFCEDKERNKDSGDYYCTKNLLKFMKTCKKSKKSKREKELEKQVKSLESKVENHPAAAAAASSPSNDAKDAL